MLKPSQACFSRSTLPQYNKEAPPHEKKYSGLFSFRELRHILQKYYNDLNRQLKYQTSYNGNISTNSDTVLVRPDSPGRFGGRHDLREELLVDIRPPDDL